MNTARELCDITQKNSFDPFQIFEVAAQVHEVLRISELHGINLTKGWAADMMDTPDPYLVIEVKSTPNGKKRTKNIDNNVNPIWEETFEFYLDPKQKNILVIKLMDANYTIDETIQEFKYDLTNIPLNETKKVTFSFGKNHESHITAELLKKKDETSDLRYSLALCDEEKEFLEQRCKKVFHNLQCLLGNDGPQKVREIPIIGLLGSGGGFRAMVCLSGVFKALSESGILDCITYVAGLSGSSWYLSTLYSHPDFPEKSPGELQQELKEDINRNPIALLTLPGLYRYFGSIINKHLAGQPVSFTDFFGHLLGDTLLKRRKESLLTDQCKKLIDGAVPLPLYTCLHVKKNIIAKVFQEWIEFSPYEVGIAKYGTFMKTQNFGSKMFLGKIVKKYPEFPLHYLQGVWGSAFCILFKQLIQEKGRKDLAQIMRESESDHDETELDKQLQNFVIEDENGDSESENEDDALHNSLSSEKEQQSKDNQNEEVFAANNECNNEFKVKLPKPLLEKHKSQTSIWEGILTKIFTSSFLDTYAGRAGMIHNPLRGLALKNLFPFSPFSPTTPSDVADFKGNYEALPTETKKLYLVDSGLTFNSPYPLLLRPQRGINLYLSFDFSARPNDQTPPFKELLLAEKWARTNKVLFPPIETQVKIYAKQPVRECYIFEDAKDPYCPVILHFVIINNSFRTYKTPGILRETEEEKNFANFDIFDDPENPYSLYNFNYSSEQFDRMSQLMEFNVLNCLELIKNTICECIKKKRSIIPKAPISLKDVAKLHIRSKKTIRLLKEYVRSFSKEDVFQQTNNSPKSEEDESDEYQTPDES